MIRRLAATKVRVMTKVFGIVVVLMMLVFGVTTWVMMPQVEADQNENANKQLALAINVHLGVIQDHLAQLKGQAQTIALSRQVAEALAKGDADGLQAELSAFQAGNKAGLHILTAVDANGVAVARANSKERGEPFGINGLVRMAITGGPVASPAVIEQPEWTPEGEALKTRIALPVIPTDNAEPPKEEKVSRALSLVGVAPVRDARGTVVGAIVAAQVLNQDYTIVDEVKERTNGLVSATIALDGVRVTTNVKKADGSGRAVGTIYSGQVLESLRAGKEYRGQAPVVGVMSRTVYVPLRDHTGRVIAGPFVGIPESTFTGFRTKLYKQVAPAVAVVALASLAMAYLVSYGVVRLIKIIQGVVARVEAGDLTRDASEARSGDEVGDMARHIDAMIHNWRLLIRGVKQSSGAVGATAGDLTRSTGEVARAVHEAARAVEQVASGANLQAEKVQEVTRAVRELREAVDQIASGAEEQARNASRTAETVARMAGAVEDVAAKAGNASAVSEQASRTAREGGRAVAASTEGMERVRHVVLQTGERVRQLGDVSDKIGSITQTITEIAEQTNLLALNAAIEAARAGEHGRGFTVVADEVRKLAERASRSASEIAGLIRGVQSSSVEAVKAMEEGTAEVEEGSRLAAGAGAALREILGLVDQTSRDVADIAGAARNLSEMGREVVASVNVVAAVSEENSATAEQMSAGSEVVMRAVDQISRVSEQNAAVAQEVASSMSETSGSIQSIAASAEAMTRVAQDLAQQVDHFKLPQES